MAEIAKASKTAASTATSKAAPTAPEASAGRTNREIRRLVTIGMTALVLLVGGGGAWAAIAQLASAVIAPGVVIVESDNKKVQHQTGGIVAAINVRNGDRVAAGDVVMTLDDTQLRANQNIVTGRLVEFRAQLARFEAERDGRDSITFPGELEARQNDPAVAKVLAGEETLFSARRTALTGQIDQLRERSSQLDEQISGLEAQKKAKELELELIADELEGLEALLAKGHVPVTRVIALKRDVARIQGELGSIVSQIAVTKGRITETELQVIQIERDFMEKVAEGIRTAQAEIAPLAEQLVAVDDQLARSLVRAPQAGLVHELAVHTVGGVVAPGETILKIVPNEDALILETRIPTTRVDDVRGGQAATIAFAGLDPRSNPMLKGHVRVVSPDLSTDERTGESYYAARIALDEGELALLGGKAIQPGMPVEVFISTGERSVIDYLFAPLLRSARHALREG
jgi:HlyD family secretion protein